MWCRSGLERSAWRPAFGNAGTVLALLVAGQISTADPRSGFRDWWKLQERRLPLSRGKVGKTKFSTCFVRKTTKLRSRGGSFVAIGGERGFEACSAGDVRPGSHRPSQSQDAFMLAVSHHAVVEADSSNATVCETRLLVPVRGMAAPLGVLADALSSRQFHVSSLRAKPLAPAYQQLHCSPINSPA